MCGIMFNFRDNSNNFTYIFQSFEIKKKNDEKGALSDVAGTVYALTHLQQKWYFQIFAYVHFCMYLLGIWYNKMVSTENHTLYTTS